jgi:nucleoside-diphosphate-sugar epimerase
MTISKAMASVPSDIPINSWVLVTGASGFIATHVIRILLERGYKVRGTVRDVSSADWLAKEHFGSYASQGRLQIIEIRDLAAEDAFENALSDVSGIIAIASVTNWNPDPNIVVPATVGTLLPLLKAAQREPGLRSFVFTSSIMAAVTPALDDKTRVERNTWNTTAVEAAWVPPPYEPSRAMWTYTASKVAAEQALWAFVDKEKPEFRVNVVSPSGVIGSPQHVKHIDNATTWIPKLFREEMVPLNAFPSGRTPSTSPWVNLTGYSLLRRR